MRKIKYNRVDTSVSEINTVYTEQSEIDHAEESKAKAIIEANELTYVHRKSRFSSGILR